MRQVLFHVPYLSTAPLSLHSVGPCVGNSIDHSTLNGGAGFKSRQSDSKSYIVGFCRLWIPKSYTLKYFLGTKQNYNLYLKKLQFVLTSGRRKRIIS